jgi:hypothetical protein
MDVIIGPNSSTGSPPVVGKKDGDGENCSILSFEGIWIWIWIKAGLGHHQAFITVFFV